MDRWILILLIIFAIGSVNAISVQNMVHTSSSGGTFIAVVTPLTGLTIDNVNHTYFSSNLFIMVLTPLSELSIADMNHTSQSSNFVIKVSTPLSGLRIENITHTTYSNSISVNVSNSNITRLVSNNSKFYTEFIASLNISLPVIVGKNNYDSYLLGKYGIGIHDGFVKFYDRVGLYPFNAVVISATINGNRTIFIYANAIDGEIAGLRYLKKHKDEFAYMDSRYYVNDIDALSVYDYMHLPENQKWYNTDTKEFSEIVDIALTGKVKKKEIDVKSSDGINLKMLELTPKNSQKINDYRNNVTLPLVFARGLWSNIYSWQDFGVKMADSGRKVYLIELTGGQGQDCDSCVNYNFNDLTNSYFPAMIGTIQYLNNNSQIQYVGHSNGARTGISSLEIYNEVGKENAGSYYDNTTGNWTQVSMTKKPIQTYIAVGTPGAFDGTLSAFGNIINNNSQTILANLNETKNYHPSFTDVFKAYKEQIPFPFDSPESISLGLLTDYFSWIITPNDTQPVVSEIPKVVIITGTISKYSDGIVTIKDNEILFNTSNADQTHQYYLYVNHMSMGEDSDVQYVIQKELNNENITGLKRWYYGYKEK